MRHNQSKPSFVTWQWLGSRRNFVILTAEIRFITTTDSLQKFREWSKVIKSLQAPGILTSSFKSTLECGIETRYMEILMWEKKSSNPQNDIQID